MVLTNAERQARYRANARASKAQASKLDRLRAQAIERAERAIEVAELSLSQLQDGTLSIRSRTVDHEWQDVTSEQIDATKSTIATWRAFIRKLNDAAA